MKLLVVEDEAALLYSIARGLRLQGYAVDEAARGDIAAQMIHDNGYDLVVLDVNLPGMDGFAVLREARAKDAALRVLMLTARADLDSKIAGLDGGANDYLTKPFQFEELSARIRNLLRRKFVQQDTVLQSGELCFDTRSLSASVAGVPVALTAKEASILQYLLLNKGCVVSQQELLEHVWDSSVDAFSNSVRMHMSSLRRKLRAAMGCDCIENVIGKGYFVREDMLFTEKEGNAQ